MVGDALPALAEGTRLLMVRAGDGWWRSPAEATAAATPEALVIDDARGHGGGRRESGRCGWRALRARRAPHRPRRRGDAQRLPARGGRGLRGARRGVAPARGGGTRRPDEPSGRRGPIAAREGTTPARADRDHSHDRGPRGRRRHGAGHEPGGPGPGGRARIGADRRKPFTNLCGAHEAEGVRAFVTQVCAGTPGLVRFSGQGLDGVPRVFEFRSVPLRRDRDTASALGVMRVVPAEQRAPEPRSRRQTPTS